MSVLVALLLLLPTYYPSHAPAPLLTTADKGLSSSKQKSLAKQFRAYVGAKNDAAREKGWKKAKRDASKATFAQMEAVLRACYPGSGYKSGFTKGVEFRSQDRTWSYTVHMPTKRPSGLLPLVIDVGHSSVGAEDVEGVMSTWLNITRSKESAIYLRTDILNELFKSDEGTQWSGFRAAKGKPNMDTVAAAVMASIADAARRFPVDPDRVYVQGISQTGFWAWYLGMYAPGRFAAIVPVGARTLHVRHYPANFKHVPVHILHGTADSICPFADATLMEGKLKEIGADVTLTRVENGPHTGITFAKWRDVWPEVAKRKRSNRYPKKIEATLLGPGRSWVHWLHVAGMPDSGFAIGKKPGRVAGEIDGQTIKLTIQGPKTATVWLSSEMVDLDRKVGIVVNGKAIFAGKPKKTPRKALEALIDRGDAGAVYSACVAFKVPE